jgi:hypothetical protein
MAYISMFHHRHGVSVAIINEDATEYWKREDGHDPSDEDEYLTEGDLPPVYAAAPELLAALRAVKSECIDMYEECYPNDEDDNDVTAAIDMAIAAIAKAEGRMSDDNEV